MIDKDLISGFDVDANGQRTNAVLETFANLSVNNNAKVTTRR